MTMRPNKKGCFTAERPLLRSLLDLRSLGEVGGAEG